MQGGTGMVLEFRYCIEQQAPVEPWGASPTSRRSSPSLRYLLTRLLPLVCGATVSVPLGAQQAGPTVRGLVSGYASVGYSAATEGDFHNDFTAALSPLLLYQVAEDVLFEGEFDVELEDSNTEMHLEHAQIHYLGFERLQFTAGMFHLPFGVWMHPNWVNRMPTPPLLYEDSHGSPPSEALLPILFDVGAMARATLPLMQGWTTSASVWVSQGPAAGLAHGHGEEEPPEEPHEEGVSDAPPLGFGSNFEDNNSDKMVGLQLRAVSQGGLILQGSGFRAAYDDDGDLGVYGLNLSMIWTPGADQPLFDLRGEGVLLSQEFLHDDGVESVDYGGYYLQLSRRAGAFEPVIRWSHLPRVIAGEGPVVEERRQLAVGLNYWIAPSIPVKAAYHVEPDGTDGFFLEWAVGF